MFRKLKTPFDVMDPVFDFIIVGRLPGVISNTVERSRCFLEH